MTEHTPGSAGYGDSCDWCWAQPRAVEIDGTTLTAVDHEPGCPAVDPPLPPRRANGRR